MAKRVASDATKSEIQWNFSGARIRAISKAVSIDPSLCLFVVDSRFSFYDSDTENDKECNNSIGLSFLSPLIEIFFHEIRVERCEADVETSTRFFVISNF